MKILKLFACILCISTIDAIAIGGWRQCNTPVISSRVDDIFMVDTQIGYAVAGNGAIVKTIDGGDNWNLINLDTAIYCRSVEFINTQKGFVGGFSAHRSTSNILRMTTDGGASWSDLTGMLDPVAKLGICGISIPDSNTIYGCGNYFSDSAYIVKSMDGGISWSFIDMKVYATHLIDMFFLNKDTGFATGTGVLPTEEAIILYTMDGGQNWVYKFRDTVASSFSGYCWKIQHLTDQNYIATIQGSLPTGGRILRSTDGGMNWIIYYTPTPLGGNGVQGAGFIDSLQGWVGGGFGLTFETMDGGLTWDTIPVCPSLNRIFRLNDSTVFASGQGIWKFNRSTTGIQEYLSDIQPDAFIEVYPNPVNNYFNVGLSISKPTRVLLKLLDESGKRILLINNSVKSKGIYRFQVETNQIPTGIYFVVLKTFETDVATRVIITH